jgi:hypothetical protein
MKFMRYIRKGIYAKRTRTKAWNEEADRLEQQRAKDEVCDILRRMIAHEIKQKKGNPKS